MSDAAKTDLWFPPEPYGTSTELVEALGHLSRKITEMNITTEDHFTSLGLRIQEFSRRAAMITGSALSASTMISSEDLSSSIEGLEDMVLQLEDIFTKVDTFSSSNMEILGSIALTVKKVEKELEGLGDTSRDLKMLALSTKIQSTRTGGGSSAFMQLGVDIAKMSMVISANAGDLQKNTEDLSDYVRSVDAALHELKDKQSYQTRTVLKWTRNIIGSMSDLNSRTKQEAERILLSTEKISQSVSVMVTSVQYQDIAKQSFEKVIGGLGSIGDTETADIQTGTDVSSTPPAISARVHLTGQLLQQIYRLEKTDELVQQALGALGSSLDTISTSIGNLTTVTNTVNRDSSRFLGDLETAMSSVTSFLRGVVQLNQDMAGSMNSLGNTVEGMSRFTSDIEMISSEVELISLNARIMAAQAGTNGAGMGVIADAVKATAAQSDVQRNTVVAGLNDISMTSVRLKGEMKNATRNEEDKLDQLVRELGVFFDALSVMQKKIVSMLSDIDKQSAELVDDIRSSVDGIRDLYSLKKEVADIVETMKELALESTDHLLLSDLLTASGEVYSESDLLELKRNERLKLVESFFREHCPDSYQDYPTNGIEEEDDIVLFDSQT